MRGERFFALCARWLFATQVCAPVTAPPACPVFCHDTGGEHPFTASMITRVMIQQSSCYRASSGLKVDTWKHEGHWSAQRTCAPSASWLLCVLPPLTHARCVVRLPALGLGVPGAFAWRPSVLLGLAGTGSPAGAALASLRWVGRAALDQLNAQAQLSSQSGHVIARNIVPPACRAAPLERK